MKKQQKDITITLIAILFVFFLWVAIATWMESEEVNCQPMQDDWTVAEVKAMQKICEKEKLENKKRWSEYDKKKSDLNNRNDQIRWRYDNISLSHETTIEVQEEEIIDDWMWIHQHLNPLPAIDGNNPQKRFENLVGYYARWFDHTVFENAEAQYWVHKELLACIAYAETGLWNNKKTMWNIMNYWNNDRWDTKTFTAVQNNVNAVAHDLVQWTYLSNNTIVWELSQWGRTYLWLPWCAEQWEFCYATSPVNWRGNVNDCLTMIEWERKDRDNMSIIK